MNIDHPDSRPLHLHLSEQTLAKLKQPQSPVKQTFLLSPTPSEESLRTDSPVLPDFPTQDTCNASNKPTSPILTSSHQKMVESSAASQSAVRLNSSLPDNMDLYIESRPPTRRGHHTIPYTRPQSTVYQDVVLGPEVKGQLPIIRDHDFPYYPLPSYFPPSKLSDQCNSRPEWGDQRVRVQRRGTRVFGLKKFLRCAFRKYGVRRV